MNYSGHLILFLCFFPAQLLLFCPTLAPLLRATAPSFEYSVCKGPQITISCSLPPVPLSLQTRLQRIQHWLTIIPHHQPLGIIGSGVPNGHCRVSSVDLI